MQVLPYYARLKEPVQDKFIFYVVTVCRLIACCSCVPCRAVCVLIQVTLCSLMYKIISLDRDKSCGPKFVTDHAYVPSMGEDRLQTLKNNRQC